MKKGILVICMLIIMMKTFSAESTVINKLNALCDVFFNGGEFDHEKFAILADDITGTDHELRQIYDKLLDYYNVEYFSRDEARNRNFEEILQAYYSLDERLEIIIHFVDRYIFTPYLDSEANFVMINKYSYKEEKWDRIEYMIAIYHCLKTYTQVTEKEMSEWEYIRDGLVRARKLQPLGVHNEVLLDVYKNLGQQKDYFRVRATMLCEDGKFSFREKLNLYFIYLTIKGSKKSFTEELADIRR